MYSKYLLAEQVWFRLKGGYPDIAQAVQIEDIIAVIPQKVSTILKTQHFSMTLPSGERIPENLMMATYNDLELTTLNGKRSQATLPIMPVSLPRNMGVYEVDRYDDFRCPFIPMMAGQNNLLRGQPMISDLLDQVGYEVYGDKIYLSKDLTMESVTTIHVRLIVLDINQYDDYTNLPIPADYEEQIIMDLVKQFAPVTPGEKIVDSYTEPVKQ